MQYDDEESDCDCDECRNERFGLASDDENSFDEEGPEVEDHQALVQGNDFDGGDDSNEDGNRHEVSMSIACFVILD